MHGAFFRASANNSRTRFAPNPANTSTKSEPLILKNGTFASPAAAFANNVLPVPGGPDKIAPYPVNQEKRGNFGEFRAESGVFVSVFEEVDEFHDFLLPVFTPAARRAADPSNAAKGMTAWFAGTFHPPGAITHRKL